MNWTLSKISFLSTGTNPWNHLPKEGVDHEFELVAQGNASALIAADNNQPIGLAIFYHPKSLPEQYRQYSHSAATLYIAEVVVHSNYAGRGIGSQLLSKITDCARTVGATFILAHRHEENLASAGMMRKSRLYRNNHILRSSATRLWQP